MNSKNNCKSFMENEKSFCEKVSDVDDVNNSEYICKNKSEDRLSNRKDDEKVDDLQIKEKFNFVENILDNHSDRINKMEVTLSAQSESLKYVIKNQEELSSDIKMLNMNSIQNHNAMLTGLNSLILNSNDNIAKMEISKNESKSKIEAAKIDGKSKLYIQICILIGSIIATGGTVYITMK